MLAENSGISARQASPCTARFSLARMERHSSRHGTIGAATLAALALPAFVFLVIACLASPVHADFMRLSSRANARPLFKGGVARTFDDHLVSLVNSSSVSPSEGSGSSLHLSSRRIRRRRQLSFGSPESSFQSLPYQGGSIMSGTVKVYLIYYGSWPAGSGQDIIENFVKSAADGAADGLVSA